ncbi:MAG: aminopeptidase P family protein [Phenylobacterium sp.]|uniref:aminopeptidase P family protein n=1 Tax=Phenylobacterium sp. TaxID=1871053 RepID=UPI001B74464E|nr:aminopeptidase P family protein [Phenylobacterium sp.]MBP7650378.1 aminopeptidase P family protein [Phenylobacterium sp.]MBP7814768.1 aminopeptidase P family protein [Phenylobacterium sp.]MBP9231996.1 aminopeptidase P family protein [Phenylobacterium sp.]MBP9755811.1 aminopeptidase P family protein [Phenylobacterium sp.]
MRQTFEETTDRSFGPRHVPLIRQAMAAQGLDGFLVPHEDEHQNEYLPAANDRLAWATGFTGSAGAAVILKDRAAVFVDGRYTLQVRDQVDEATFEIRDLVEGGVPAYLESATTKGQVLGYDPRLHSPDALHHLKAAAARSGAELKPVAANPLDQAWGVQRPAQPTAPVVAQPLEHSGEDSADKRARIGKALAAKGADATVLTAPSSIAWLFNVRGGDVIRSPLPLSQAILHKDGTARLFLDPAKVTADLPAWLGNQVTLETPDDLPTALADLKGKRVLVDPALSSAWYFEALAAAGAEVVRAEDPCALPRAAKNKVEIAGTTEAHARDGVALARFLHWLATEAQTSLPDEVEVVTKLEGFREETGALKDLSFDTIAGAASNGAIVHYRPTIRLNKQTVSGSLLLVDSGAQYLDGTTDVTRTVAIGEPSQEMRERFTLVLKGHLALAAIRFPAGTTGSALDILARAPLWARGLDYDHGTGHGVGSYLGVHEGPQRIAKLPNFVALQPGMILSNEPGYYKEGAYGIRIENLQYVTEAASIAGGERPMLGFETLTLAPIDRRLIVTDLLTPDERAQLDAYHARVLAVVGPRVPADVRTWMGQACAPL